MHHRRNPFVAVAIALLLCAGVADAQTKIKSGFNLFSAEQDVEIGRQSAAQAEAQLPVLRDAEVNAYINDIGQRLARNAGGPNFPYQFKVVNASDINAFALPGGPIYINRGIIDQSKNEGEVAGVIAHEIAHVALRHGTHQASKAYAAQAGISILGGLLGGKVGSGTANIINAIGGFGLNALFLKFSREMETQADIRGAQILAASGYAPADMVGFFRTLEQVDKSRKTSWLSDHPAPPDRIARIQKEAQVLQVANTPTTNVAELHRVQSRLRSFGAAPTMEQIARTGPQQGPMTSGGNTGSSGAVVQVEAPSSSLRTYTARTGLYRISHPSNWRVHEEGNNAITIAPEGGVGSINGRTEVVYGAMISHYDPFGNTAGRRSLRGSPGGSVYGNNVTLEQASQDLLTQIQQSSPHLTVIRNSTQRFQISGSNALSAALRGTNPNTGIQERVTLVTRQLADDHLMYFLFVTPERDASSYAPVLQSMVNSLRVDDTRH